MKKFLLGSLAFATLALTSCSEENEGLLNNTFEVFTGEIVSSNSRTSLGSDNSVLWSGDDAINLFKKTGYYQKYKVKSGGSATADFVYDNEWTKGNTLDMHYAVYPYAAGNTISESTISIDLSSLANQTYTANSFEEEKAVMVAKSATTNLPFTNTLAVIRVNLNIGGPVNEATVSSIKIASAANALTGNATIDMSQDKPQAVIAADGGKEITLTAGNVALSQEMTPFYIMFPAGIYAENDLTVVVNAVLNGESKECEFILPAVTMERSKITTLEKTFDDDEEWTGSTEAVNQNVADAAAATDALATITGVKIEDASDATVSSPITIPAKETAAANQEHVIEFATMPASTVYIAVAEGNGSSTKTVENLEVIVPVGTTTGNLNINAPGTTVTIKATDGTIIDTIEAITAENTLIIESGVTVNNLIVKGGNVEVYGKVSNITRVDNNDPLTYIYVKEGAVIENYPTAAEIFVVDADNKVYVNNTAQLQAALNNAAAGVKLLDNITISSTLSFANNFVMDGDNHTLTYTGQNRAIDVTKETNGANLTLMNLTIDCTASYCERGVNYNTNGELTFDNVTVKGTNVTYALNLPASSDEATVNINNSSLAGNIALNVWGENATINVTDTHLTSVDKSSVEGYTAIALNNDGTNVANGTKITINGGSVIAKNENGEPSNAVRNSTVTGTVNISFSTVVVGEVKSPVAIVDYGTTQFYSFTNLQDAIDKVLEGKSGIVKLINDIVLEKTIKVKGGHPVVIDLNGHIITGTDKNTSGNFYLFDNTGTLTIEGNGTITLTAENDRDWNASSVVVANNPGGNLTINSGVVIEHLGGTDMAYGVDNLTNGKGTYAVTTLNGATVKSTYRAVRQFLNGIEATNELYIKSGIIEGANKSVWMHDPSNKANTGKLVVEAGAQLKGDVYLFVTAGSTEWPVEVSIAEASLVGESQVVSGNVPEGYEVVLSEGYYIVKK